MNLLTYKLAPFLLLASSLVTSAYCMERSQGLKWRQELSNNSTEQINAFATHLQSSISQNLELPNILLGGPLYTIVTATRLAQRCSLTCLHVSIADLCKDDPNTAAKNLEELFKLAETTTKKVMLILKDVEAFELSDSITKQFLNLTDTPSSKYMLAFITNNHEFLPKALSSKVATNIYIDTAFVEDSESEESEVDEVNLDDITQPEHEAPSSFENNDDNPSERSI